jgi:hypothetical protein
LPQWQIPWNADAHNRAAKEAPWIANLANCHFQMFLTPADHKKWTTAHCSTTVQLKIAAVFFKDNL